MPSSIKSKATQEKRNKEIFNGDEESKVKCLYLVLFVSLCLFITIPVDGE